MTEVILVTGATGTVGSEVVKALRERGAHVRAGVHTPARAEGLRGPGVELVELAFDKPASIDAALKGATKMFLITPFSPEQVEVGTKLVDAAKRAGVRHVVKLSAFGAENEPGIQVGRWHRQVELHLEASGLAWTHLRPNNFMQNFANYYGGSIKSQSAIFLPLGDGRISYVHARDVAGVGVAALLQPGLEGKTIPICGPEALRVDEAAELLSQAVGRTIRYVDVPDEAARKTMSDAGMPAWAVTAMMELHAIGKAGYAKVLTPDVERYLGRKQLTFESYAREVAPLFR